MQKRIYGDSKGVSTTHQRTQVLLDGCKLNNRMAQKELYATFYNFAMSIALRYTSNPENAAEMTNDAFLKIFKNLINFVPGQENITGTFIGWLKKVVVYSCIDYLRKYEKKHKAIVESSSAASMVDDSVTGLNILMHKEILVCVSSLPPRYRAVFDLYIMEGYSHAEVGEMLDISEGTSKSNLYRARKFLQDVLENKNSVKYDLEFTS